MDLCFPFFYFVFVSCAALLLLLSLCSVKLRSSIRRVQRKTRDLFWAENMILVQNLIMERLRPIVNLKCWDYCVLWKLGDDQRFLEWLDCCCAGSENMIQNGGDQELPFPVSSVPPCRDIMLQHPRTKPCDLLANLPFSILLDSGIYAQTLMSNQVSWLNFSNNSDSNALEETVVGTRVLIPVPIGLVELFVAKQVGEDPQTIDFVTSSVQQAMINSSNNMDPSFSSVNVNELMQSSSKAFVAAADDDHEINTNAQKDDHNNLPYDVSVDRIRLSNVNSAMNFLQQFNNNNNEMSFFEGSNDSFTLDHEKPMNNSSNNNIGLIHHQQEEGGDSIKQETAAAGRNLESVSDCSDPNIEDELDDHHHGGGGKYRRRSGTQKGQAKNLLAERKRRRKLNDRLYSLRALVPNISKLDRASILGDAIEFVKELQKQVEDLQRELEDQSEDEGNAKNTGTNYDQNMNGLPEMPNQNGIHPPAGSISQAVLHDHEKAPNGFLKEAATQSQLDSDNTHDKLRQMEPQVEVAQLDGNEFFVKVFCEHRPGSLVRLMTTLNSLGLEVTNVNVTSSRSLVSNVFKVEKRDSEMVQAAHVRESLLEITRNPYGGWPEITTKSENYGNGHVDYHDHRHQISSHHHHHRHLHHHDQA